MVPLTETGTWYASEVQSESDLITRVGGNCPMFSLLSLPLFYENSP